MRALRECAEQASYSEGDANVPQKRPRVGLVAEDSSGFASTAAADRNNGKQYQNIWNKVFVLTWL